MTVFEQVRQLVDIEDAARRYGVEVSRTHKALCPFHAEKTPSLSFKGQHFTCFGCGMSGSVIDFTMQLFHLSAIDAVRQLNDDFMLRLDLDKPVDRSAVRRAKQDSRLYENFHKWVRDTYRLLCEYRQWLIAEMEQNRPSKIGAEPGAHYTAAAHTLPIIEYWLDVLFDGDLDDKLAFYQAKQGEVKQIAGKIRGHRENQGGFVAGAAGGIAG